MEVAFITMKNPDAQTIADTLVRGGIVVIRTDTLYGVIACVNNEAAVQKVYAVKQRNPAKQCIVLLASSDMAPAYQHQLRDHSENAAKPTTVVVPATNEPIWLRRTSNSIAYRVTSEPLLNDVIRLSGPVVAPSANPEGQPPARTIAEARAYFGDAVDLYVDGGTVPESVQASHIVSLDRDGNEQTIRQ